MAEQDRFDGIAEFVTTARSGSFTSAAAELGITGSAVGKSVSRLEARLRTKLLHRTTRRLTLTHEGQAYLETCLRILDDLDGAELGLATGRGTPVGTLHLNLPAAFGRLHVMPVLLKLSSLHPRLAFSVMFTERRTDIVGEGVDLAVRIGALENDSDLTVKRLGTQRLLVCASPDYLARYGAPASIDALNDGHCVVGWRRVPRPTWLLRDSSGQFVPQHVRIRHEFNDGEAMVQAVLAGEGLCQLPTWLLGDHIATGALVPVLDQYAGAEMPINAIWPSSCHLQPKLRIVIDALASAAPVAGSGFMP